MKKIKLFENFSKSYIEIDDSEHQRLSEKTIPMSNKNKEIIENTLGVKLEKHVSMIIHNIKYNKHKDFGWYIMVDELPDEYFLISFYTNSYKCDQLEGVFDLFRDKGYLKQWKK